MAQGEAATEAEREGAYGIPGPWITDLTNGWNLDAAPHRPRVQLLRVEGALAGYDFDSGADALGGFAGPDRCPRGGAGCAGDRRPALHRGVGGHRRVRF